jgi:hypothetical protein
LLLSAILTAPSVASAAASGGRFYPVPSARLSSTQLGPGARMDVRVLGTAGVPASGVGAIVLRVAAAQPTATGYLAAYPAGSQPPAVADVSFGAGRTVSNLVSVEPGTGGMVSLANTSTGSTRVDLDVVGYFTAGAAATPGAFTPVAPTRLLDRTIPARGFVSPGMTGHQGVPASGVSAVLINLTMSGEQAAGAFVAFPAQAGAPQSVTGYFAAGTAVSELALVPVGADGRITVANHSAGTVEAVGDVVGYFTAGAVTDPDAAATFATPSRIADSSTGLGLTGPLRARHTAVVQVGGVGGIPRGTGSVLAVLAVTSQHATGWVTAFPAGSEWPSEQQVNASPGPAAGLVVLQLPASGRVAIGNAGDSNVQITLDVLGYLPGDQHISWARPSVADPPGGSITAISCPTRNFCIAGDLADNVVAYRSGTWGPPVHLGTGANIVQGISCVSAQFCVAVDDGGHEFGFDGSNWSAAHTISPSAPRLDAVACATATFCAATDNAGGVVLLTASGWGAASDPGAGELQGVSCPSSTFCLAVGRDGAARWDGTSWLPVAGGTGIAVSCASTSYCLSIGDSVAVYNGSGFAAAADDPLLLAASVSCRSPRFCVAGDLIGQASVFDGTSWSDPVQIEQGDTALAVSCATQAWCQGARGTLSAQFAAGTWSAPVTVEAAHSHTAAVSCPTSTRCLAVDDHAVVRFDGTTWTSPRALLADTDTVTKEFNAVSCTASGFCAATYLTNDGTRFHSAIAVFTDTTRTVGLAADPNGLYRSVSCASASMCVAVDTAGYLTRWDGSAWSSPVAVDDALLESVSCPAVTWCLAVDGTGRALVISGTTATAPVSIDPGHDLTAVSCPAVRSCVAVDDAGAVLRHAVTWSGPAEIDSNTAFQAVSCTATLTCVALDEVGRAVTVTAATATPRGTVLPPEDPNLSRYAVACAPDASARCVATADTGFAAIGMGG